MLLETRAALSHTDRALATTTTIDGHSLFIINVIVYMLTAGRLA
jgi:hypothetical protein